MKLLYAFEATLIYKSADQTGKRFSIEGRFAWVDPNFAYQEMRQSLSSGLVNKPFFVAVNGARINYRLYMWVNHEGGHFYEIRQLPLHKAYSCAFRQIFVDPFRCICAGYVALEKPPPGL